MNDVKPSERTAIITYHLVRGEPLTTRQAAELTQASLRTAQRDLTAVSRVLPIVRESGVWRVLGEK